MHDTAGELTHKRDTPVDEQRQEDQVEPTKNNSVPIHDIASRTKIYRERWTIEMGGERGSGRSVWQCNTMIMIIYT